MPGTLIAVLILFFLGVATLIVSNNLFKMIMALIIIESAVLLFAIGGAYIKGSGAPLANLNKSMVNPLPQALTLTAIVIGAATTALALSLVIKIYKHTDSVSSDDLTRLKG
ncbi:MAG: sodium:proton antiporter [Clostridia bacterium]